MTISMQRYAKHCYPGQVHRNHLVAQAEYTGKHTGQLICLVSWRKYPRDFFSIDCSGYGTPEKAHRIIQRILDTFVQKEYY